MITRAPAEYEIDFQGQVNQDSSIDNAPRSLLSDLNQEALFMQPTFDKMLPLLDNYVPDVRIQEDHTPEEQAEEDEFLNEIMKSAIMSEAVEFLIGKKYLENEDKAKSKIKELWFQPYDRDGTNKEVLGSR